MEKNISKKELKKNKTLLRSFRKQLYKINRHKSFSLIQVYNPYNKLHAEINVNFEFYFFVHYFTKDCRFI